MQQRLPLKSRIKLFALFFLILISAMILDCQLCYPETILLYEGERLTDREIAAYSLEVPASAGGVLTENGTLVFDSYSQGFALNETGGFETKVKLFGVVPVRSVKVRVEPAVKVVPGGNTVGIKILTKGLVCVGTQSIEDIQGQTVDVARREDVRAGDIFLMANDKVLSDTDQLAQLLLNSDGSPIRFIIKRNEAELEKKIAPVKTKEGYKLGLWIRDSTAGIGTLTYYNPEHGGFGALGHAITDADTGALMPVSEGNLLQASVIGVLKGKPGEPGELKGVFKSSEIPLGVIEKNTEEGIYGHLYAQTEGETPYPVASSHQVKEGPATIVSNVEGEEKEVFSVEIKKTSRYQLDSHKDMIIHVTDERLLEKTGGIVQGMSGSPILQNGRIVGAVTHVFVNDPTRGYGIFIENMLNVEK